MHIRNDKIVFYIFQENIKPLSQTTNECAVLFIQGKVLHHSTLFLFDTRCRHLQKELRSECQSADQLCALKCLL